ncbi:MAG: hypothetical protein HY763_03630 [Planctomycetes bacterium]|nr:hypothetical protein [Planctomycetota bacterium]
MTELEATAEVFYTALKALSKDKRDAVLLRLAEDTSLARDLLDLATVAARRHEPSRPFRQYLAGRRRVR